MKLNNRVLGAAALILCVLSVWSYRASVDRADRFERGRLFLPHLNPDTVAHIAVTTNDQTLNLDRGDGFFTVRERDSYPARNEAVNGLLRDILEIGLEKEVGDDASLAERLGLTADAEGATTVKLAEASEKTLVHFVIARPEEGGAGTYVRRLDGDGATVFLTEKAVNVDSEAGGFLQKLILDVKRDDVESIRGRDFRVSRADGMLQLAGLPRGREEKPSEMRRIGGVLTSLRFDEVYPADHREVQGLAFAEVLDVALDDGSGYRLQVATRGEGHFLKVQGYHTVDRIAVERDESDEELESKARILERADEISKFNTLHGSWIYAVGEPTWEKLTLGQNDLTQKKE